MLMVGASQNEEFEFRGVDVQNYGKFIHGTSISNSQTSQLPLNQMQSCSELDRPQGYDRAKNQERVDPKTYVGGGEILASSADAEDLDLQNSINSPNDLMLVGGYEIQNQVVANNDGERGQQENRDS